MRALWSARVRMSPNASETLLSISCESGSLRQARLHQRLGGLAVAAHEERTGMGELAAAESAGHCEK